ncbi:MAG: SDR family oxidoreductase [Candidatus Omnitrophota bacterium]
MFEKIAVVTGGNRGIGFEICRQLALQKIHVILASRNVTKGLAAAEVLRKENLIIEFHQLDVTDGASILRLARDLNRCDILVNNAGIFIDSINASGSWPSIFNTSIDVIRRTMETNVYGPILLCQAIVPLMKKNHYGRIVNLSSGMGQLASMNGGSPAYRISKTAINVVTRILADELRGENILVNSMSPGWVRTDMGGPNAPRKPEEGADTAVYLATLPDNGPTGGFFEDRKMIEW